jgi:hypothetical protein
MARKVGEELAPEVGPAHTVADGCVTKVCVKVPEVVTGDPEVLMIEAGELSPTL